MDKMNQGENILNAKELKSKLTEIDKGLIKLKITGYSKNKLVSCEMNGKLVLSNVSIDSSLLSLEHKELLEESVTEAFKKALTETQNKVSSNFAEFSSYLKND